MAPVEPSRLSEPLEQLYAEYNRPELIHPDPRYPDAADREVAALVASSLAYGRVELILRAVGDLLGRMGPSPARFLRETPEPDIRRACRGFGYRFAREGHAASLLVGAKCALERHGSLESCFLAGWREGYETVAPALSAFVTELSRGGDCGHLLPDPSKRSACKRLNLMLRWLVRRDAVDPGGWERLAPSKLVIPVDVHMHRAGLAFGFTSRKQAGLATALEITAGFRRISPDDPVKYDFSLTRLGIRADADLDAFLAECARPPETP